MGMTLVGPLDIILGGTAGGLWEWAALAGLALMTSVIILGFIYIWGVLFRNQALTANTKQELYEVIVTAIMIGFIYAGIGAMSDLTISGFLPQEMWPDGVNGDANVYNLTAQYYLTVDKEIAGWLESSYLLNFYMDQIASVTPYARPLGVGLVASPMAGVASPIKQLLYNMSVALSIAFILNYAQLLVYTFSLKAFLNYYLPLGILLRAFTPTRRIGGTLIGVALTFLFIFPALTCLTYSMFYNPSSGPLLTFRSMTENYLSDPEFQTRFGMVSPGELNKTMGGGVLDLIGGALGGIGTMLESLLGTGFLMLLLFPTATIAMGFVIGFIMPAVNILVLTQAAKVLSKSFGDEVDISSLTRLI